MNRRYFTGGSWQTTGSWGPDRNELLAMQKWVVYQFLAKSAIAKSLVWTELYLSSEGEWYLDIGNSFQIPNFGEFESEFITQERASLWCYRTTLFLEYWLWFGACARGPSLKALASPYFVEPPTKVNRHGLVSVNGRRDFSVLKGLSLESGCVFFSGRR